MVAFSLVKEKGKKWFKFVKFRMKDSNIIGTICETVRDYENDYKHLRRDVHVEILRYIEFKIVAEYLNAIASR